MLQNKLTTDDCHRGTADFNSFNCFARANNFHLSLTGAVHPVALFCGECRSVEQAVVPEVGAHTTGGRAGKGIFKGRYMAGKGVTGRGGPAETEEVGAKEIS